MHLTRRQWEMIVVMFLSALFLKFSAAAAQEYYPIVPLRITGMGGALSLGTERERDLRENPQGQNTIEDRDNSWFEEFKWGLDGYVYHPYFLEFNIDTDADFNQENDDSSGIVTRQRENFYNYNVGLLFLKKRPVSLGLGFSRDTQETNSTFTESQRTVSNQKRAVLNIRKSALPTFIGFNSNRTQGQGENRTDNNSEQLLINMNHKGHFGRTDFLYKNEDLRQKAGNLNLETDDFTLAHQLQFGEDRHQNFLSRYLWRNQKGTYEIHNINWTEDLRLHHSRHFQTFYAFNFNSLKQKNNAAAGNARTEQTSSDVRYQTGLQHQLYESLFTHVNLDWEHEDIDRSDLDTKRADMGINYRKRIPFGILNLHYTQTLSDQDQQYNLAAIQVSLEEHTFGEYPAGPGLILLDHTLAETETIVLKNPDGTLIVDPVTGLPIEEGVHYRTETTGERTWIRRLPLDGDFLQDRKVAVDYTFQSSPPLNFRTMSRAYGTRLDIRNIWSLFFTGIRSDQILKGGTDQGRLEDTIERRYGTEVRWKSSRTLLEKQSYRSIFSPYSRTTLSETIDLPLHFGYYTRPRLLLNARYIKSSTFEDTDITIDRSYSMRLQMHLTYRTRLESQALYRNMDLVGDKEIDVTFRGLLHWRYRNLLMTFSYENSHQRFAITGKEKHQRLYLKCTKLFGKRRTK